MDTLGALSAGSLQFVAAEEVVFLAAGAVGTLQAADEKHGNSHRDQDGKDARVDLKPVHQTIHTDCPISKQCPDLCIDLNIAAPIPSYWFDVNQEQWVDYRSFPRVSDCVLEKKRRK